MKNTTYSFSVLRYRHDPIACEQINVGILISFNNSLEVSFEFAKSLNRVKHAFPSLDTNLLRKTLKELKNFCDKNVGSLTSDLFSEKREIVNLMNQLSIKDDGAFSWSEIAFGNCSDLSACKERLFDRYIAMYETEVTHRRDELQIWKPFRDLLAERELEKKLTSKNLSSSLVSMEFKHTFKNGILHCYEPISFDLVREEAMQDKAAKWVGNLCGLEKYREEFKVYFIVGKPSNNSHLAAFERAVELLNCAPTKKEIWYEEDVSKLADNFENLVNSSLNY